MDSHVKSKDIKNFGSTYETCRNANVRLGSLEWKPSRLKEQFLDCDGRAIYWQAEIFDRKESNSKVLFLSSTSRCRKRTSRKYKKSNMFILVHHRNIYKSSFHNRSTFHPLRHVKTSLPQEGFPSPNPSSEATAFFVLRIHRRLGLDEPLDDRNVAVLGCQAQRCEASGSRGPMAQALQTEPSGNEREKNFEKNQSFGNCGTGT